MTKELVKLLKDMKETMKEENGLGLAAPQVNHTERICIVTMNGKPTSVVNPDITWMSEEKACMEEGCLSLPGENVKVERSAELTLKYLDEEGQEQTRRLHDLDARVVQHEVDHLNGVLIVDYQ